ncbi:MAG: alpha/beta hydrolase [Cyclobacteriaceae bacterium]|nr:alpha/beta hydrolase [Cyclobacteriaceae bacterium]
MKRTSPPLYNQAYITVGQGPVVILLHGLFGNLAMWKSVIEVLKNEYKVIVPRLPLFELTIENTNVKYLAKTLHDFIDWHQLTDVILIGHALGGQVALMYTHQYPQNVDRLILTSSTGLLEKPAFTDSDVHIHDYEYIQDRIEDAFYHKDFVSEDLVNEIFTTVQSIPKRLALGSISRSAQHYKVTSFLNKIDHPVLLMWGLQDKISSPESALHFHDLLPNSEVKFIDECGHVPMVEQAEQYNKHLLGFLKEPNRFKNWYG